MAHQRVNRSPSPTVLATQLEQHDAKLPEFVAPSHSISDLLHAIPSRCFERSALKASAYIIRDLVMIATMVWAASHIDSNLGWEGKTLSGYLGIAAKWFAWANYWWWNGLVMTGIWIAGHECGHQAFSTSKTLNNAVGLVLHSALFVPYHNWRISHARHHAANGHMTRDEVFVPRTKSDIVVNAGKEEKEGTGKIAHIDGLDWKELVDDTPIWRLVNIIGQQLFGWPLYLFMNVSGQKEYPAWTNHFDPASIIFDVRHRQQVLLSDAALLVMAGILHLVSQQIGFANLVKYYLICYLEVNHWLVMIVYLQHTDPMVPHYRAGEWTFPRGALCTIDRNLLGPIGPYLLHGICETHVVHHLKSSIPHYHAWEATRALKEFLGDDYLHTDENMFVSLWKVMSSCKYVEDDGEVLFYKDAYGRAGRKVKEIEVVDSGVDLM